MAIRRPLIRLLLRFLRHLVGSLVLWKTMANLLNSSSKLSLNPAEKRPAPFPVFLSWMFRWWWKAMRDEVMRWFMENKFKIHIVLWDTKTRCPIRSSQMVLSWLRFFTFNFITPRGAFYTKKSRRGTNMISSITVVSVAHIAPAN